MTRAKRQLDSTMEILKVAIQEYQFFYIANAETSSYVQSAGKLLDGGDASPPAASDASDASAPGPHLNYIRSRRHLINPSFKFSYILCDSLPCFVRFDNSTAGTFHDPMTAAIVAAGT